MIIKDVKTDLSDAAQEKLKGIIEQAVEKKLQKEMKKITKKLTVKFIVTGVAMAGAVLLVNNAEKITDLFIKQKKK